MHQCIVNIFFCIPSIFWISFNKTPKLFLPFLSVLPFGLHLFVLYRYQKQLDGVETFAVDGAEPDLEWESGSEGESEGEGHDALYDRTEEKMDAWSDGGEEEEEEGDGYSDMDALRWAEGRETHCSSLLSILCMVLIIH